MISVIPGEPEEAMVVDIPGVDGQPEC